MAGGRTKALMSLRRRKNSAAIRQQGTHYSSRCGHGSSLSHAMEALAQRRCASSIERQRSIFLMPGLGTAAVFTSRPLAGSGCCRCLVSQGFHYTATAYPSIRIYQPRGRVSPSGVDGMAGASKSGSIKPKTVSMQPWRPNHLGSAAAALRISW